MRICVAVQYLLYNANTHCNLFIVWALCVSVRVCFVRRHWAWHWDFLCLNTKRSGAEVRCCFRPLCGAQQWEASEPLVTDEEPLAHQPALCYANSSAPYAENDPFLPFLNKIDFILSFYCRLSCLQKAVIWWCLMVWACLCVPDEEAGVFCVWIPELCEKDRFLWDWI